MARGATLCTTCESDQSIWRNELKYWSGIVGLITLVVSGATFSLNFGREAWQKIFGQTLAIADFSSTDILRVWNISNTDVWIKQIKIKSDGPSYQFGITTSLVIKPKEVGDLNYRDAAISQWEGTVAGLLRSGFSDYATDMTPEERDHMRNDLLPAKNMFVPDFLYRDGPEYAEIKGIHGGALFTFPCTIEIEHTNAGDASSEVTDIPCVGTLRRLKTGL